VLQSAVMAIADDAASEATHLITQVRHSPAYETFGKSWVVFNEFVLTRVSEHEALHVDMHWKRPVYLFYVQKEALNKTGNGRVTIPEAVFQMDISLAEHGHRRSPPSHLPGAGQLIALDAEFVTLQKHEEGQQIRNEMSVARVSCIDGSGEELGQILLDDYIRTQGELVLDYLTEFSGIEAVDLDPIRSKKHLTTLKHTYLKLLHLVDRGCVFVGHGLANDLRTLCLHVPMEQLRDTVHLFHLPQQRLISLQFLAWHLLGDRIQSGSHDSVEDAHTALRLLCRYEELRANEELTKTLNELYEEGKRLNWKIPEEEKEENKSLDE